MSAKVNVADRVLNVAAMIGVVANGSCLILQWRADE